MKTNSAEIIKTMRKEMGLSQAEMAEQLFISVRQLARIESGEAGMDVWQFITTLELLGAPTEDFWLLYLDSGEYASYRDYKHLKRQINSDDWSKVEEVIRIIEKAPLIKQPIVKQYVAYAKVAVEMPTPPSAESVDNLLKVMHMSKPNFDESKISEYRMTNNEISIALSIANCFVTLGEYDRAIKMVKAMINSRENARVSEEDKINIFPALYLVLSSAYWNGGQYKEALYTCQAAIDTCREYSNLERIPEMLFCMADCYYKLGEEEHIYKTHLIRAYHMAYAIGKNKTAVTLKENALKSYGVSLP
ncbi:MAG: helix-turn-helix domain-containing protein [Defluviitaleaceae bacterium]|nr:helix-turn-helix domain-containing protein [Defluviitaleaceae bacterium]